MKESWLYYDYLRCWWWLLLLGPTLGGSVALVYHLGKAGPLDYTATLTATIGNPTTRDKPPSAVRVQITGHTLDTKEAALESARSMVIQLVSYTDAPVQVKDLSIDRHESGKAWWKHIIFGSVAGIALAVGAIYVWEDASAYQRHRRQSL